MMTNPILDIKHLSKFWYGQPCVKDLCLTIMPGEVIGLLGPNGAGKTTAFYMIIGLVRPDGGQVFFLDEEITGKPVYQRAKMGMGYLAQEPSIFRGLTVEQNILCILETLPITKQERKRRLESLLQELHLEKLAKKKALSLSGGERRRLEITRALATRPRLILLDEPLANIDPITIEDLKEIIRHLKAKGISILITDHNAREIFSIVERSYLIQDGSVIVSGTKEQLLSCEKAIDSYFGTHFL